MADTARRRMRSANVAIGVTAVVAAALSGCSAFENYTAVCVDEDTMERVADFDCDDQNHTDYVWYYLGSNRRAPSVGSRVSGGSMTPPGSSSGGGSSSYDDHNGSSPRYGDSTDYDSGSSPKYGGSTDYGGFGGSSGGVSS